MYVASITLHDFRNYEDREIIVSPGLSVLVGPNGTGKTNVLEAVQLLTSGRSFRRPRWSELVRWGCESGRISAEILDTTPTRPEITFNTDNTRSFRLNGVSKRRVSDITGMLPCVVFTPDDLQLTKGAAEARRIEIDDLGEQLSKTYGTIRRDYARIVRHKNVLLREWQASDEDLEPWDIQVASLGSRLLVHRRRLLRRIADKAEAAYVELSGAERLTVGYTDQCGLGTPRLADEVTTEEAERSILQQITTRRRDERARRVTLVGPHRDEITFRLDSQDARAFASQGQQRTIALAWKLAEVQVVEEVALRKPVLLLDDVMSELDAERRRALTNLIQSSIQTFVSTTDASHFDPALLAAASLIKSGEM